MSTIVASFPLTLVRACLEYRRLYSSSTWRPISVLSGKSVNTSCGSEPLALWASCTVSTRIGYISRAAYITVSGNIVYPA